MATSIDDILAGELAKLGGFFAGLVSRRLPNNVGEVSKNMVATPTEVLPVALECIRKHGRVLEQSSFEITGIVGGGRMNLNPVHVTVQVQQTERNQSRLFVRAVAKEGISKQYAGEQTANLVAEYIAAAIEL